MKLNTFIAATLLLTSVTARSETAFDWHGAITLESVNNLHGGLQTGPSDLGNIDLTLNIDTEAAGGWSNGEFFIYALGDFGNNPSEKIGDAQGVSNIATDTAAKIYELWYQHHFMDNKVSLLFGLHDYNSAFYSLDSTSVFTHSSFGIGPDVSQIGPSIFATTSTAIAVHYDDEHHYLLAAIYDGIPGDPNNPRGTHIRFDQGDGSFISTEFGLKENQNYKLGLGFWQHSASVENPINQSIDHNNSGLYLIAEKSIKKNQNLFVQLGHANRQSNQLEYYIGAGISVKNLFKEDDTFGFGVAHARNSEPFLAANPALETAETTCELTYFAPIIEHVGLQGSIYYVQNPSMDSNIDNALAFGARAYFEL